MLLLASAAMCVVVAVILGLISINHPAISEDDAVISRGWGIATAVSLLLGAILLAAYVFVGWAPLRW